MATAMPARRRQADPFHTGEPSFRIHEDAPSTEDTEMNESALHDDHDHETEQNVELLEDDGQESEYTESSEDDIPESGHVQEDMERLQNCLAGFRQKYRLIKRIGEGWFLPLPQPTGHDLLTSFQAPSRRSTKPKTCSTIATTTRGTWTTRRRSGRRHH
jgi:hypothetical protein